MRAVVAALLPRVIALVPDAPSNAHAHEAPHETPAETAMFEAGPLTGTLLLPGGGRPLGAVILMHDALGPDPRAAAYADQLLPARIAVLTVQRSDGAAESLEAAAAALTRHPRIGGAPVGLVGFGQGGRLVLRATAGIAAHAVFYPGCAGIEAVTAARAGHPVVLIHGAADEANPAEACDDLAARLRAGGATVRHLVYRHAGYAWDYPAFGSEGRMLLPRPDGPGRIAIVPWPALTAMGASQLAGFMRSAFVGVR